MEQPRQSSKLSSLLSDETIDFNSLENIPPAKPLQKAFVNPLSTAKSENEKVLEEPSDIVNWIKQNSAFLYLLLMDQVDTVLTMNKEYNNHVKLIFEFNEQMTERFNDHRVWQRGLQSQNIHVYFCELIRKLDAGRIEAGKFEDFLQNNLGVAETLAYGLPKLEPVVVSFNDVMREKIKFVVSWISTNRDFLSTSFTGGLGEWVQKNRMKPDFANYESLLNKFAKGFTQLLESTQSIDIRKVTEDEFPSAKACFIDSIVGLKDNDRNAEIRVRREGNEVLKVFLLWNPHLTDFLAKNLAGLDSVVSYWQSAKSISEKSEEIRTNTSSGVPKLPPAEALASSMRSILQRRSIEQAVNPEKGKELRVNDITSPKRKKDQDEHDQFLEGYSTDMPNLRAVKKVTIEKTEKEGEEEIVQSESLSN